MSSVETKSFANILELQRIYNVPLISEISEPNGISHSYQLDKSISVLRVVGWYCFIFIQILIEYSVSKQRSAASDLGLHCLFMSHKKEASLQNESTRENTSISPLLRYHSSNIALTLCLKTVWTQSSH